MNYSDQQGFLGRGAVTLFLAGRTGGNNGDVEPLREVFTQLS